MKKLLLLNLMYLAACTTAPTYRSEWVVDMSDKAQVDKFMAIQDQCKDFAYRAKVAGSGYAESDIMTSCIQHRGFEIRYIAQ